MRGSPRNPFILGRVLVAAFLCFGCGSDDGEDSSGSGGSTASGGAGSEQTGGSSSLGGFTATGGAMATGGATATGGASTSGGATGSTGGSSSASGGVNSGSGGNTSDPGCSRDLANTSCSGSDSCQWEAVDGCSFGHCNCNDGLWGCAETQVAGCGGECPSLSDARCGDACDTPATNCYCSQGNFDIHPCSCIDGSWSCQ